MDIYSYSPLIVPGPMGHVVHFTQADGELKAIELTETNGRRYVGVPSTLSMPEQPEGIDWRIELSTPEDVYQSRWHQVILRSVLERLAAIRWQKTTSGVAWNDWPVRTLPEDIGAISSSYAAAKEGIRANGANWKFADGILRPLTNAQMISLAEAVFSYTQACFDYEAELAEQLRDGQSPDIEIGWP